jgi:hypothetical protein
MYMKTLSKIVIGLTLFVSVSAINAQTVRDIFTSKYTMITFMGLDFSKTNFIGSDFGNPQEIKEKYFREWTEILMAESKYDLKDPLRKSNITYDFNVTANRNKAVSTDKMISYDPTFLTINDIEQMISEYETGGKTGIGLTFIVNVFDRTKAKSVVDVVFFDMASKKIFLVETVKGEPGGNGIRNYWANSIASIITKISDTYYRQWEDTFVK